MKFADFVIAETLDQARSSLKELGESGLPVAGGTAFQYLSDRPGITAVDISRIGLQGIEKEGNQFRIGANTTLTDLVRYRADGWVLHEIATLIPTHQVRNISTVGGNISRLFPWSELPLGLLVLDATIVVQGDSKEEKSARDFFAKRPSKTLQPGDLVTEVIVPAVRKPTGFGYKKENVSNSAFGLMTAAAAITLDGATMKQVRVAVGSAVPAPVAVPALEEKLTGQQGNEFTFREAIEATIGDMRWQGREGMSDKFGAHLAHVIIQDALTQALERAKGEEA